MRGSRFRRMMVHGEGNRDHRN